MAKVRVTVAAHEVEIDADCSLDDVVAKALYVLEQTATAARAIPVGFDTGAAQTTLVGDDG
jgi:hypothetical protein